ncbi:aspartic peptidase domain-containing protein [Cytidiella melzeri]|nr:aspartic peptidase domain-containing protein [Cytidiella melzeri]
MGDGQIIYVANVTVDGQSFEVQLDTGSADFWLNSQNVTFTDANNTHILASIGYLDTTYATGDVYIAAAQFGNYSIPQQAFINAPGSNATSDNDRGLLGLGPSEISQVQKQLNGSAFNGQTVMYNLFDAYPNTSTYITFLMARSNLGTSDGGIFTVGETDPNWSQILDQPKQHVLHKLDQWLTLMDGVIVNGKNYSGHGLFCGQDNQSAEAYLITQSGLIPQYYFDLIYKTVPGIKTLSEEFGIYQLPCDTNLNVSMIFNGTEVPINPLDLTMLATDDNNNTICVNAFAPTSTKEDAENLIDFTLGDSFLRNVYILYNYGNWTSTNSDLPYIQLLPTTIQSEAYEQFDSLNNARIQQWEQVGLQYNGSSSR